GVGDHGRRHEIPAVLAHLGAAGRDLGALLLAQLDIAGDTGELFVGDQRAHLGIGIEAGAELDRLSHFADPIDHLIKDLFVHEQPRARAAGLALIEEDATRRSGDGALEICIGKHDRRRLAAELQRNLLEVSGGAVVILAASTCLARCAKILYVLSMPDKKRTDLDWEDVRYFVALARHRTLSATARALHVNHATVARRIASLEALLGHPLFDRPASGYALTAEGKALVKHANAMNEAALSILRRLDAGTELSGRVRLAAGRVLAERFLIDRLRAFHERYPAINLEVIGGSRVVSLAKREADIALRYGSPKDSELVARRVARLTFGLYGSQTTQAAAARAGYG